MKRIVFIPFISVEWGQSILSPIQLSPLPLRHFIFTPFLLHCLSNHSMFGHLAYAFNAWSIKMLICILCLCKRWEEESEESYSLVRRVALLLQQQGRNSKGCQSNLSIYSFGEVTFARPMWFSCDHAPLGILFMPTLASVESHFPCTRVHRLCGHAPTGHLHHANPSGIFDLRGSLFRTV